MRKMILLAAVLAVSASAAFSQASFGVKGGLNLSNVTNSDADMKMGYYGGLFGEYQVNDFFGVAGELLYSNQGTKGKEEGVDITINMNYLNIPVLAKLYIAEGLSLDVGPQFGLLMSAKGKAKQNGSTSSGDLKDKFSGTDVSAAVGLTYNLGNILIQGRYNLGLTDTEKESGSEKYKNAVIQLGVGYRF